MLVFSLSSISRPLKTLLTSGLLMTLASLPTSVNADRLIESSSLASCMTGSQFTVQEFNFVYTPGNQTISYGFNGVSTIEGNVTIELDVIAYGFTATKQKINPCQSNFHQLCPMAPGNILLSTSNLNVSDFASKIPGIAFTIPDLDGKARIWIKQNNTPVACLEAELSNGKSVNQNAVSWVTAIISGTGLLVSGIASGLGYSNTAAHVAANALSLFGYFQSQAMIGMVAVNLPPVARSWTQNFTWSMGIIRIKFMQNILAWYIQATGGTPALLFNNLQIVNVEIEKRSLVTRAAQLLDSATASLVHPLVRRASTKYTSGAFIIVTGIKRMSFLTGIEETNFFMTGLGFLVAFIVFVVIGVMFFKLMAEFCVKQLKIAKGSKFVEFRRGWRVILKGILYRIVLIAFPQMSILCLWELTVRDSVAAVILAITFILTILAVLCWASFKVIKIAKHSIAMHKSPAYILYSDPASLNRWGFLYVQFKASCYYWIIPLLCYIFIKGCLIAFGQNSGAVQAVGLVLVEGIYFISICVTTPWMDRKVNVFNIAIGFSSFLNAVFLLLFSSVFSQHPSVAGVCGVIFFIANTIFSTILLILVLTASIYALVSKNPDVRYQPMRDDRGSFIKSQSAAQASTELDALGATARGEPKTRDLDEDSTSVSDVSERQQYAAGVPLPSSQAPSQYAGSHHAPSHYASSYREPVSPVHGDFDNPLTQYEYNQQSLLNANSPRPSTNTTRSPIGTNNPPFPDLRPSSRGRNDQQNQQPQANRWQVGAGYDH